jgi:cbb3-type cytochrome oxidase subunit 3
VDPVSTLELFFIILALVSIAVFLYAFRALGSTEAAEREILERQRHEEGEH